MNLFGFISRPFIKAVRRSPTVTGSTPCRSRRNFGFSFRDVRIENSTRFLSTSFKGRARVLVVVGRDNRKSNRRREKKIRFPRSARLPRVPTALPAMFRSADRRLYPNEQRYRSLFPFSIGIRLFFPRCCRCDNIIFTEPVQYRPLNTIRVRKYLPIEMINPS